MALLVLLAALLQAQTPNFQSAGVCSRCHVAQVLEWSVSKHSRSAIVCQSCHGPSAAHVANERDEVKPDRPAPQCASCHAQGCPKTKQTSDCESCHHHHSLTNPKQQTLLTLPDDGRQRDFRRLMDEGEHLAAARRWRDARASFDAALKLYPKDPLAERRRAMCNRRLNPEIPGFEIVGNEYDAKTGLAKRVRVKNLGLEMVLIPEGDLDLAPPAHTVHIDAFYLARTELTMREWSGDPQQSQIPVHDISWLDAMEWIAKLNRGTPGAGFRLPTEVEWELAAKGSVPSWFRAPGATTVAGPRPVAQKQPNVYGLYDMLGNVAEWTLSVYRPYPYTGESPDPNGLHVIRGGSYADSPDYLEPALRHAERPNRRIPWNGMRLARSVPR
ncbi:MAG TPA: SUMF1/EgtB/PvdO family nonheme iron enzyme [Terriglobales bacterium]|nr:SUMF1/EgtB/PvdO family nonheme iron enzyme [Terriglobales bacterium]